MGNLLELAGDHIFSGVPSNAAWDIIKFAWVRANNRDWETLFVDAFESAVQSERARLSKYAGPDAEIRIDKADLHAALHYDLGVPVSSMTFSSLTDETFGKSVAAALVEKGALIIGGHTLTEEDYASIITGLVRRATVLFREAVLQNEEAFRQAILDQSVENSRLAQQTLAYVETHFLRIHARFDQLEQRFSAMMAEVVALSEFARPHRYSVRNPIPPPDSMPRAPEGYVRRPSLIQALIADISSIVQLAIVDGPGKGKTQTAREFAATAQDKAIWWISLREAETNNSEHLREQLVRWQIELTNDHMYWEEYVNGRYSLNQIADSISRLVSGSGLLVIDDLPDPTKDKPLYKDLITLIRCFGAQKCKLLTTGLWPLPAEVSLAGAVLSRPLPNLTNEEISYVLLSAGAPKQFAAEGIVAFIRTNTDGNPILVRAMVEWLRRSKWNLDDTAFDDLLSGRPADEVRKYKRIRLLQLLEPEPRHLLHRLTLVGEQFDRDLAIAIALVPPSLAFPGDAFDQLSSPWLELHENGQYRVSPMLKNSGVENLTKEVQTQVHLVVADNYLSSGPITTSQVANVASHLLAGQDYDRFIGFLIQIMLSANTPERATYLDEVTAITHYYSPGMSWPEAIDLRSRIMLRAAQIRSRMLAEKNWSELEDDLSQMIGQAGEGDESATVFALLNTGPLLLNHLPPHEALPAARKAIRAIRIIREIDMLSTDKEGFQIENLIWLPVWVMDNETQLEEYLNEIRELLSEHFSRLFTSEAAIESASHMTDLRWMLEADKPREKQNWQEVLSYLDSVQDLGKQFDEPMLEVVAARTRAIVLADHLGNTDGALAAFGELPDIQDRPRLLHIVHYTRGCILHNSAQPEQALEELDVAVAAHDDSSYLPSSFLFDTKRRRTILLSRLERWEDAKSCCIDVIRGANSMARRIARLEMMGELALIHWSSGDSKRAGASFSGYVRGLVAYLGPDEPRYHEAFVKAGHGLSWLLGIAEVGAPPSMVGDGETFALVTPGFFGMSHPRLQEFQPKFGLSKPSLLEVASLLSSAISLSKLAWNQYKASQSLAPLGVEGPIIRTGLSDFATLTARYGELSSALRLAVGAVRQMAVIVYRKLAPSKAIELVAEDVDQLWSSVAREDRVQHEKRIVQIVFAPAFSEVIGSASPRRVMEMQAADWETAVADSRDLLEEPHYWTEVARFLKMLVVSTETEFPTEATIPGDNTLLKILWHLVASTRRRTPLQKSLSMQVSAILPFVDHPDMGKHLFAGFGRFLHLHWSEVAAKRGFAVSNPTLFRSDLRHISPAGGAKTIVGVIIGASRAISVALPPEVITKLRVLEEK